MAAALLASFQARHRYYCFDRASSSDRLDQKQQDAIPTPQALCIPVELVVSAPVLIFSNLIVKNACKPAMYGVGEKETTDAPASV